MSGCFKSDGRVCICDDCLSDIVSGTTLPPEPTVDPREIVSTEDLVATLRNAFAPPDPDAMTHYQGCWRSHPWCLSNVAADCIEALTQSLTESQ